MNNNAKKITFENVIGYEKEKTELKEIQNFIVNAEKYEKIGARIPKGILLLGESGNGKTLMARALASEIEIPLYSIGDELNDDESIKSIRKVFSEARENSPCVIFIDEIDKLEDSNEFDFMPNSGSSPVIRELLTQIDGFKQNSGIVVVATANSIMRLNPSLLRSGRIDRIIDIRMPNKEDRKKLFEYYAKEKKIEDNINYEKLAIRTSGVCCADIDNILNDAALMSIREGSDVISLKNIEKAIDRIMLGSATENKISDEMRKEVAIHEIGHAIVSIACGMSKNLNKISIVSRGQTLGFNRHDFGDDSLNFGYRTKNEIEKQIMIAYGGLAAEKIMLNDISTGCINDLDKAKNLATQMVKRFGMSGVTNCVDARAARIGNEFSERKTRQVEKLIDSILKHAFNKTIKAIKANKELFNRLYNKLLENNVLYKEEIDEIIAVA